MGVTNEYGKLRNKDAGMKPEEKARQRIDQLLSEAGWVVQDVQELNLGAAPGVAVHEFPLESGYADYMLFVDPALVSVVVGELRNIKSKYHRPSPVESPYMLLATYQDGVIQTLYELETTIGGGVTWRALDDQLNAVLTEFETYGNAGELADFVFAGGRVEALRWLVSGGKGHIPGYFNTESGRPVAQRPRPSRVIDVYKRDPPMTKQWCEVWARVRKYPM